MASSSRRPRVNDAAAQDSDSDDEETRRVEFLRRHRAMLEQKRRLETERRVSELESDKANIAKRQSELKAAKESDGKRGGLGASASLPSLPGTNTKVVHDAPLGVYARADEMSLDTLRMVAEKQALRDMAPLNTRGKYHARYMKDAYPIAGSQLKLEKERELILTAKKRLLLAKAIDSPSTLVGGGASRIHPSSGGSSHAFGQLAYRKLDFYVDKFSAVLQNEQIIVDVADKQRRVRLAGVEHREGLEQFWSLMHGERYHETLMWLKTHRFRDVNLHVVVQHRRSDGAVVVEVNKDVGETPLMASCRLHDVALVRALLDQGAVVYLTTANGDTAMHCLFYEWREQQLTTLRRTTEMFVRAEHTLRILQMLVTQQGADVNAQNAFGETVLQHCARLGLVTCVELLLSHWGDPRSHDRSGGSALSYARANHHDDLARLLETFRIVEKVTAKERTRRQSEAKLKQGKGVLTADWSESPERLLARLAVEDRRAGHLRNQFVDRHGNVIVCADSSDDE